MIEFDNSVDNGAKIRVVGVGGGGTNAINSMMDKGLVGVDFICINTDRQHLEKSKASNKIQIGKTLTRGLGAGSDPTIGHRAAEEDKDEIARSLADCDMVFITAGMGGGTGTGGSPVIANIAKSLGALVVGIVTKPFNCEGKKRMAQADYGLEELKKQVDTLIVIPNQKLLSVVEKATPLPEAFNICNQVLYNATRGISELITVPGLINLDFADVRTIMREMGDALMGTGVATGENRAVEAANAAISSPLLEGVSIAGAQGVLVNITGGRNLSITEFDESSNIIKEAAGDEANVILGAVIDENMTDEIMVTVIATGFNKKAIPASRPGRTAKVIDHIPSGLHDLQKLDSPAYIRKGIQVTAPLAPDDENRGYPTRPDPADIDKPAFLRKIMD